jgi:hypothetical protein
MQRAKPIQSRIGMNGELLQAANYLCNKGLTIRQKTSAHPGAYHPRNLDPPLPACYLPAEAFPFWHLTGEGVR